MPPLEGTVMAALQPAIDRINYLVGRGHPRKTPRTITRSVLYSSNGNARVNEIYSYGMCIAWKNHAQLPWEVTTERSSRTTNRHIQAARIALEGRL